MGWLFTVPHIASGILTDDDLVQKVIHFAHTQSPLLQEVDEQHQQSYDTDHSKVDPEDMIEDLVDQLEISPGCKNKLKSLEPMGSI